jgi:hypothetical protein
MSPLGHEWFELFSAEGHDGAADAQMLPPAEPFTVFLICSMFVLKS